jgi:lipopolysaccharide export system protein LptC
VRVAKYLLPTVAGIALLAALGFMWLLRVMPTASVDIAGSGISDGKLVMANPKLDGFTADDRPYSVRAARAIQDLAGGAIDLENVIATVPIEDGVTARITAPSGTYDSEENILQVDSSLSVETTDGMRAELKTATIDMEGGNLVTPDPVRISITGATIDADRLTIEDNGKRMIFESRVKLVVQPEVFRESASGGEAETSSAN